MNLGRRTFVQLLGAAAYSVVTPALSRVRLATVEYRNEALGFALHKPSDWFYLSYEQYSESGAELSEADSVASLRESMGQPTVTIAKYVETPPLASPSIVVFAEAPAFEPTEQDLFDLDMSPFAESLQDFVLEEEAIPDELAGLTASRTKYSYTHSSTSGETLRQRTVIYGVLRKGLIYSFNFTDVLDSAYSGATQLAAAKSSIAFFE